MVERRHGAHGAAGTLGGQQHRPRHGADAATALRPFDSQHPGAAPHRAPLGVAPWIHRAGDNDAYAATGGLSIYWLGRQPRASRG